MAVKKKAAAPTKKKAAPRKKRIPTEKQIAASRENAKKGGAPTRYKPEYCAIAKAMIRIGGSYPQVATELGVSLQTIFTWRKKHKEFDKACKLSKKQANKQVEDSLFRRATGYDHNETKVFCNEGVIKTHDVNKHYPPDVHAIKFWLINNDRDKYAERKIIGGDGDQPLIPQTIKVVYED